ncbi:hypothetical protein ABPG75_012236 [Micractinium tetrahymenae]
MSMTPCRPAVAARAAASASCRPHAPGARRLLVTCAQPDSSPAYEPLENAIRVINRVIALGERAKWVAGEEGSSSGGGGGHPQGQPAERWVQFGAAYNSRLNVEQPPAAGLRGTQPAVPSVQQQHQQQQQDAACSSGGGSSTGSRFGGRQLADYLALPVEEYSLLDPKWISREEGGMFRFSLPLQDLVNVDMQPEIYISVLTEAQQRRVTLAGTRAALGSPELDQTFKLNVTAVVSKRQLRRLPVPDHLPGRPVYRLRRWAAAARGRTWPAEGSIASGGSRSGSSADQLAAGAQLAGYSAGSTASSGGSGTNGAAAQVAAPEAAGAAAVAAAAAAAAGSAPFPSEHVYISHDENDEDEYMGPAELAAAAEVAELAVAELEAEEHPTGSMQTAGAAGSMAAGAASGSQHHAQQPGGGGGGSERQGQGQQALLHCRAQVTMAVRVPKALKVVPNALLGYAGSLLLRAVLSATLPNFLELLAADYRRWAGLAGAAAGARQLDTPVGELFLDAAATVREGQEWRRQHPAAKGSGGEEGRARQQEPVP